MQTFSCLEAALDEAQFCARQDRRKYFVYFHQGRAHYIVRQKFSGKLPLFPVIEVGFGAKQYKEKDYI